MRNRQPPDRLRHGIRLARRSGGTSACRRREEEVADFDLRARGRLAGIGSPSLPPSTRSPRHAPRFDAATRSTAAQLLRPMRAPRHETSVAIEERVVATSFECSVGDGEHEVPAPDSVAVVVDPDQALSAARSNDVDAPRAGVEAFSINSFRRLPPLDNFAAAIRLTMCSGSSANVHRDPRLRESRAFSVKANGGKGANRAPTTCEEVPFFFWGEPPLAGRCGGNRSRRPAAGR